MHTTHVNSLAVVSPMGRQQEQDFSKISDVYVSFITKKLVKCIDNSTPLKCSKVSFKNVFLFINCDTEHVVIVTSFL